jgi:hypothetical protein
MNKKQAKMLRQFADRVTHAPGMTGPVRWEVAAYVDGEKQCVDGVFWLRSSAEKRVAEILRRNGAEQTNEVELRIDPVQG